MSKKFELKGSRDVSQLGGGKAKEEPMSEDDEDEDEEDFAFAFESDEDEKKTRRAAARTSRAAAASGRKRKAEEVLESPTLLETDAATTPAAGIKRQRARSVTPRAGGGVETATAVATSDTPATPSADGVPAGPPRRVTPKRETRLTLHKVLTLLLNKFIRYVQALCTRTAPTQCADGHLAVCAV